MSLEIALYSSVPIGMGLVTEIHTSIQSRNLLTTGALG